MSRDIWLLRYGGCYLGGSRQRWCSHQTVHRISHYLDKVEIEKSCLEDHRMQETDRQADRVRNGRICVCTVATFLVLTLPSSGPYCPCSMHGPSGPPGTHDPVTAAWCLLFSFLAKKLSMLHRLCHMLRVWSESRVLVLHLGWLSEAQL